MKVLILGAKGNLGQQLVKMFKEDYDVTAWDIEDIDIADENQVKNKISGLNPCIIINAAAYNVVDNCETDQEQYELAKKLNGDAAGYIADVALEVGALLVHYSTDYVFRGDNINGYKENDEPRPISKYGETKLMGERELIKRSPQGLKWYLVRTSKLFGPVGISKMTKPSFFDIMLKTAKEKKEIEVVDEEMSCFTYTPDLAKTTKELVESGQPDGIYHLVNQGPCTWYEAVKALFKLAHTDVKVNAVTSDKFPRPAKRPKYSVLLNTKLKPLRDWQEALKEYINNKKCHFERNEA